MQQLPPAPDRYNLKDQDHIRKILEQGLDDIMTRLQTLETQPSTPPPPPPPPPEEGNAARLRIGLANSESIVGLGPTTGGYTATPPLFGAAGYDFTISVAEVVDRLAEAQAADSVLIFAPSRGRNNHMDPVTDRFSRAEYESTVREYEGIPEIQDAIDGGWAKLIIGDEFNHPSYNNSCFPDDVNWMGNLHKQIWPGAHTLVRMGSSTLKSGWNGSGAIPNGFWTGLDYGWEQRAGQHNNETLQEYYDNNKADLASVDLGMIPGLNWWNGGIKGDSEGVNGCWDIENNDASSGYIVGSIPGSTGFSIGQHVPCGTAVGNGTALPRMVSSPDWIKHWADIVTADLDAPFGILWVYLDPTIGGGGVTDADLRALSTRSDMVDALKYAINKGATRTVWNGWRPAKPGVRV